MEELNDEQIQAMLESGLNPTSKLSAFEHEQIEGYQQLFKTLETEPERGLPFDFSAKVSARLKLKLKRRADLKFNLLAALGIVLALFVAYGILTLTSATAGSQFLSAALKFKWILIMASILLLGSMIFDQKVVEEKY